MCAQAIHQNSERKLNKAIFPHRRGQRRIYGSSSYAVEAMERRLVLSAIPVTVRIDEVLQLLGPDTIGDGDYFAKVQIGSNPEQSNEFAEGNPIESASFQPGWTFTGNVDPTDTAVPITIKLFDSDPIGNDTVDIAAPTGQSTLNLTFNVPANTWTGGVGTDTDSQGFTRGFSFGSTDADGSAEVFFTVFRSVPVTAHVLQLDQIDNPDDFPGGGDGDYEFFAKIGDNAFQSTGDSITFPPGNYGSNGFAFTDFIDPRRGNIVQVTFKVVDTDIGPDDTMDINAVHNLNSLSLYYNIDTGTWTEQNGTFSFPTNTSQGDGDSDRAKITFDITEGGDSDGDGIPDFWETNGVDVNHDGIVDLTLNTNPQHKDLFVEVDAMKSYNPKPGVLNAVVSAFAAAPNSLVHNPDGQVGVTLHAILDETNVADQDFPGAFVEFDQIKQNTNPNIAGGFGTVAERASSNAANMLAAKRLVFRYAIWANHYGDSSNTSSGVSEIGGNDFMVTLGTWVDHGTFNEQAGTFMHELGHTLGLHHGGAGGADDINNKPNYYSIMNYTWQVPHYSSTSSPAAEQAYTASWNLDYSRENLGTLNESHLNEGNGIGGDPNVTTMIGPRLVSPIGNVKARFVPEGGAVDFNGDGDTSDSDVNVDISFVGDSNNDGTITSADGSPGQTLNGHDDWSNLQYGFRFSDGFADGVHPAGIVENNETLQEVQSYSSVTGFQAPLGNGADNIVLRRNGANLEILDNNVLEDSRPLSDLNLVQIQGADGEDDTLIVDFAFGGFFALADGVTFNGGAGTGSDKLKIIGTGATTGSYTPSATTPGAGSASITDGTSSMAVNFGGLEPVEVSAMTSFSLVTPNSNDVVSISDGLGFASQPVYIVSGTSGGVALETLDFFNVTTFTLDTAANDGASPSDNVTIGMTSANAAGTSSVIVNTGPGNDTVSAKASPAVPITLHLGGGMGDTVALDGETLTFTLTSTTLTNATHKTVTFDGAETLALSNGTFDVETTVSENVVVNNAATLIGSGPITGSLTANTGGTVSPGVGGPGILQAGDTTFTAGSTFTVDLPGDTAGVTYDQLQSGGSVSLGGATISGTAAASILPGDEFVIIHKTGASTAVTGQFAGGSLVTIDGKKFAVDYAFDGDGDGQFNDVALLAFGAAIGADPCDLGKTALFVSATTGDDNIRFVSAKGNKSVQVLINGQDQGTFSPTGLLLGFGQAGNDTISVEMPSKAAWLYGQGGNDTLLTGNNDGLLIGGLGDDKLIGGNGKDVLIGGPGADNLDGGNGEDLLIAGSTVYDTNTVAHRTALCKIDDEWTGGSGGASGRASHLTNGGGRNGTTVLNSTTVFDDSSVDHLVGGNGQDWLILNTTGGGAIDQSDGGHGDVVMDI